VRELELSEETIKLQNQSLEAGNDKLAVDLAALTKTHSAVQHELSTLKARATDAEEQLKGATQQVPARLFCRDRQPLATARTLRCAHATRNLLLVW
jgi:hypothetical protein